MANTGSGGTPPAYQTDRSTCGSSPRMRGTPDPESSPVAPGEDGSSPRMRGTPLVALAVLDARSDHPRACGELKLDWIDRSLRKRLGSSPRMRGTRVAPMRATMTSVQRIIPAHAGNSIGPGAMRSSYRRMQRIIPAHAGNSFLGRRLRLMANSRADHPRACGELGPRLRTPDHAVRDRRSSCG